MSKVSFTVLSLVLKRISQVRDNPVLRNWINLAGKYLFFLVITFLYHRVEITENYNFKQKKFLLFFLCYINNINLLLTRPFASGINKSRFEKNKWYQLIQGEFIKDLCKKKRECDFTHGRQVKQTNCRAENQKWKWVSESDGGTINCCYLNGWSESTTVWEQECLGEQW